MKRMLLAFIVLLMGCASPAPFRRGPSVEIHPPDNDLICWSDTLMGHGREWQLLAEKQLHVRPIVFTCHGDTVNGDWILVPDAPYKSCSVTSVAQTLHAVYPGRPIILIVCNPGKHDLHVENVYYCKKKEGVWSKPGLDGRLTLDGQWKDLAGHFEENFVEGKD